MIDQALIDDFLEACCKHPMEMVKRFLHQEPLLFHDERCKYAGTSAANLNNDRSVIDHLLKIGWDAYGVEYFRREDAVGLVVIHGLAMFGDSALMERILDAGVSVDTPDVNTKGSPLHTAAAHNQPRMIQLLIDRGANVNALNSNGRTALHHTSDIESLKALLQAGADVNAKDEDKQTPLHYKAFTSGQEGCELLLKNGADINARGMHGETPLLTACVFSSSMSTVIFLLEVGADTSIADNDGNTIATIAEVMPFLKTAYCAFLAKQKMNEMIGGNRHERSAVSNGNNHVYR